MKLGGCRKCRLHRWRGWMEHFYAAVLLRCHCAHELTTLWAALFFLRCAHEEDPESITFGCHVQIQLKMMHSESQP
eukprot:scaffold10721_cov18-Tisochrysis_lutea.AAC.8